MRRHKQAVAYLNGVRTLIDRDLTPLIAGLSKLGIQTFSSCQAGCGGWCKRKHRLLRISRGVRYNHRPKACLNSCWIAFDTPQDAEKFLKLLSDSTINPYPWVWTMGFYDDFNMFANCVFPRSQLNSVIERVKAHLIHQR